MRVGKLDDLKGVGLLRQHPARHHQIRPVQIDVQQFFRIAIDQAALPRWREQCGDGYEAERWGRKARPVDFASGGEIPKGLAVETRHNQQDIAQRLHGCLFRAGEQEVRAADPERKLLREK